LLLGAGVVPAFGRNKTSRLPCRRDYEDPSLSHDSPFSRTSRHYCKLLTVLHKSLQDSFPAAIAPAFANGVDRRSLLQRAMPRVSRDRQDDSNVIDGAWFATLKETQPWHFVIAV